MKVVADHIFVELQLMILFLIAQLLSQLRVCSIKHQKTMKKAVRPHHSFSKTGVDVMKHLALCVQQFKSRSESADFNVRREKAADQQTD